MNKLFNAERMEQARRYHPEAVLEQARCEAALAKIYQGYPELLEKRNRRLAAAKRRASDELS